MNCINKSFKIVQTNAKKPGLYQFLYDICDISIAASVFIFFKMCMG